MWVFARFVRKLNVLFDKRRQKYAAFPPDRLPTKVARLLARSLQESEKLHVKRHTDTTFEVQRLNAPSSFCVVDLDLPACSCGFYVEHGVPCRHLCAAIVLTKQNPLQFVVEERQLKSLKDLYADSLTPIDMSQLNFDGTKPPSENKRPGSQKEKRTLSIVEKGH